MEARFIEEPEAIRALRPGAEDPAILWFRDDLHNPYPVTPLGMSTIQRGHTVGQAIAAEEAQLPPSRGPIDKSYGGRVYRGFANITDPAEIGARAQRFGGFVQNSIDNWEAFYGGLISEAKEKTLACVHAPLKSMTDGELAAHVAGCQDLIEYCWYVHFKTMFVAASTYMMGEKFAGEHGWKEDAYARMLKGFDTFGLATDRGQYELAEAALADPVVAELFLSDRSTEDLVVQLQHTAAGAAWWKRLREYVGVYGYRLTAAVLDLNFATWFEDPACVVENVRQLLPKLSAGATFQAERDEVVRQREETIASFRATLAPEEADMLAAALPKWQNAYKYMEDHWYYLEQVPYTGTRWAALEAADRLVALGILDDREDIFFLSCAEIVETFKSFGRDPKAAAHAYRHLIRPMVTERKRQRELDEADKGPEFLGSVPESLHDPLVIKIYGLTDHVLKRARAQLAGATDGQLDVLEGFPGAPGVVEGRATLVMDYKGFARIQSGGIMVCPFTSPAWTSVFPKLAGIVTDSGGMLTHAAIAAREYGVPAVVGTWVATTQIHDGDLIRIDGNNGRVEILERVAG
jgi:pyruvate, water dikinase